MRVFDHVDLRIGAVRLLALTLALGVCLGAARAADAEGQSASSFVQKLADDAVVVLSASDLSDADRRDVLAGLMRKNFDTKLIARFAVGSYWDDATQEQRDAYVDVFGAYFVKVYGDFLGGYGGETLYVLGQKPLSQTDDLVATRISGGNGTFQTDLRVRRGANGYRIIDIMVESVSMLATHRSEFGAVAKRRGFDGLIEALRQQTAQLDGAT